MPQSIDVAVVGATGLVGETIVQILEQRKFPLGSLHLLASEQSAGKTYRVNGRSHRVTVLSDFDFSGVQIALFSAGGSVSAEYAPVAADAGAVVVDNTSQFRNDPEIPLVVAEVNPDTVGDFRTRGIIANPNCSTMQLMLAVKPLHDAARVRHIQVATYQSVSGAGRKGINMLARQTALLLNGKPLDLAPDEPRIAFNAWPHIDDFQDNGYTREEMKMVWESQKILNDPDILVNPTAVRIPVFYGHSEAVTVETERDLSVEEAAELLAAAPGVTLKDDQAFGGYPTAAVEGTDTDPVFVGRLRRDISRPRSLNFWVVADNVRKGAALNTVQIAEILVKHHL
ncbi:MAG: aspartate-semialdehyde dehydrogenase [Gammaproteobacteria bacterium]|nr:aspartate-semialdehyde dehydrogenase [Gammaproteobacteria bacterium]